MVGRLIKPSKCYGWFGMALVLTLFPSQSGVLIAQTSKTADVIVYGATPGGFCAAIAAAREGASVLLLEPTDHVGGLSTGGLSHCDSNQMVRSTLMGLFDEWHRRVVQDYTDRGLPAPYDPNIKDQATWTFEPHVAKRVTLAMLGEAGVAISTGCYLKSVVKSGPRIEKVVTTNGAFEARVYIDGTYEGDLMAAAGVEWTIGREGRDDFGESLAGQQYPKQVMQIDGFDDQGQLLPLLTVAEKNDPEAGDQNVMTYSFRLCLTEEKANQIPIPKPKNYNPARFEIVRRALQAGERRVGFDLYPLPGAKLDGNNSIGGQFSIGWVGAGNNWHSANQQERQSIWEAHKQYTLEFYYFLTTDPSVPAEMRDRYLKLGLCKDEFQSYQHFSPALYVRESRRLKGLYVIKQQDILESPQKEDPIAVSSFPIDSHDCQRIALKGGGVINEGTIFPVRREQLRQGYAYHVPYRSILPHPEQCDNLLVPVALSSTHVAISSLRIEGAWMVIGQGAGVAAALSVADDVSVQTLEYAKLRDRLLAQNQVLDLPVVSEKPDNEEAVGLAISEGIVLDDTQATLEGEWSHSQQFKPFVKSGYLFCGEKGVLQQDGEKCTARFRFVVPESGKYEVRMYYSPHPTRAQRVPLTIASGTHMTKLSVDQTKPLSSGLEFRRIGTAELESGIETTLQISNAQAKGFVILDAIQLLPTD